MFEEDAKHDREWRKKNGKAGVRAMIMSGEHVFMTARVCGHYLPEENPEGFCKGLGVVEKR